jgi:alpha-tubulin suppressor-like RCC1 family protein
VPLQVGAATTWSSLAVGYYHSCAIRNDASLWCWGDNGSGQLGLGDTTDRTTRLRSRT